MASAEEKGGCFTLIWEIKNFGLLLEKNFKLLCSPVWKVKYTSGIAWASMLAFHSRPGVSFSVLEKIGRLIDLLYRCEMSLISSCGEVPLKVSKHLDLGTFEIDELFCEKRQSILPNDTLTFRCRMWGEKIFTQEFRICSVLHSVNYLWNIEEYRSFLTYSTYIEKDNFLLSVDLSGRSKIRTHAVKVEVVPWTESCPTLVDCALFIKDGCGRVINGTSTKSSVEWRRDVEIFSKNITSINFKLQMTVALHKICQDPGSSGALGDDLLRLYRENPLSDDATLNTEGKSFSAHRDILAARSPVSRAKFEMDEMSEARLGVVDIDDVDSETVDRMRMQVFLYSDLLDGVQWEEAGALYCAADKYAVLSLKQKCATILKTGLTADNFCDALVLVDRHKDEQLMTDIVHFIRENDEVISTEKWDNLQSNNPRLASKILRELCVKNRKK